MSDPTRHIEACSGVTSRVAARFKQKKVTEKGNTVYVYSERQVANRNRKKAERLEKLSRNIETLRKKVKADLQSDDPEIAMTALAVALIDHTYERPGNEGSADEGHFGVTGWHRGHVTWDAKGGATIKYVGKSGVKHEKKVTDPAIRKALRDAYDATEGKEGSLFSNEDAKVDAPKVNEYLSKFDVTAKDLRGFHANREMQERLREIRKGKLPEDPKEREKALKEEFKEALEGTAKAVGHEAATLKTQYLVPGLEDAYLKDGTVMDGFDSKKKTAFEDIPNRVLTRYLKEG